MAHHPTSSETYVTHTWIMTPRGPASLSTAPAAEFSLSASLTESTVSTRVRFGMAATTLAWRGG